jgi:single-stranded-DNA-specific exonuclease
VHPKKDLICFFARQYNCHPLLVQYLFLHGVDTSEKISRFLYPTTENFYDPFLLNDVEKAVSRILEAIKNKEKILIFGDYDCDGITSTSILLKYLKKIGADVTYRLPLREEGYGITPKAIHEIAARNISLIITVDNGSAAHSAMSEASRIGIDIVVTDHHEILGEHPDCYAFVNPKRCDNTYPFPDLCGAGVAFKLVHALCLSLNMDWNQELNDYIELVALGTIADLMPLKDENRIICKLGLRRMNVAPSPVFSYIFGQLKVFQINSGTIGFQLAPLFNALGRIDDPNKAVRILTENSLDKDAIQQLFEFNQRRKQMTQEQFENCDSLIKSKLLPDERVIVVFGDFHHGIIGILASKIAEKYNKPAIVIAKSGTGSCRSVNGTTFSIVNALKRCEPFLIKYGGHQAAAGFSIEPSEDRIISFCNFLQESAKLEGDIKPCKKYFTFLSPQDYSNLIYKDIHLLEPFGQEFNQPLFLSNEVVIEEIITFGHNSIHAKIPLHGNQCFYLFNGGKTVSKMKNSRLNFYYSSTLSKSNEFIIQGIKK